ncbi:MAG: MarR family transcriptional regulator [Hyphomicrobiales bacterium]|nr:MAG: MarR family transcriptional regulator [Hyphomicrobiales bacterium]
MDGVKVSFEATLMVRDRCMCLHAQRAARVLARRFDLALRPFNLTNEQFSLLMSLNRPNPATIGQLATLLGADRTTLTAALKPLVREGLAVIEPDTEDRRSRRVGLTAAGHARLGQALPAWLAMHNALEATMHDPTPEMTRQGLNLLAAWAGPNEKNLNQERTP